MKIQENKGMLWVTIPKDVAKVMRLEKGQEVLFIPDIHGMQAIMKRIS